MNYAKIVPCDIANGEGVRVTLFVQGCNHHCPGCQNPTTWDPNGGQPFTDETLDKIVDLLRPEYIQGLTLTVEIHCCQGIEKPLRRLFVEYGKSLKKRKMCGSGLDISGRTYGIRIVL